MILLDTDLLHDGETFTLEAVGVLERDPKRHALLLQEAYNSLGALWSSRAVFDDAFGYLKKAEAIYHDAKLAQGFSASEDGSTAGVVADMPTCHRLQFKDLAVRSICQALLCRAGSMVRHIIKIRYVNTVLLGYLTRFGPCADVGSIAEASAASSSPTDGSEQAAGGSGDNSSAGLAPYDKHEALYTITLFYLAQVSAIRLWFMCMVAFCLCLLSFLSCNQAVAWALPIKKQEFYVTSMCHPKSL